MTPAVSAARRARVPFELHSYKHDPGASAYGMEAAEALGIPPERVFKTLVAVVDGTRFVVAVVPVAHTLDLKALAGACAGKRAAMSAVADAERVTGYVAGGISPLGQKKRLQTVVDDSALVLDTVFVSAGRRGLEIELAPADLVRLCGARTASLSR